MGKKSAESVEGTVREDGVVEADSTPEEVKVCTCTPEERRRGDEMRQAEKVERELRQAGAHQS